MAKTVDCLCIYPLLPSPKRGEEPSRGAQDLGIFDQNLASLISSSPKLGEGRRGLFRHCRIHLEQLLQPLGVIFETPPNVDPL